MKKSKIVKIIEFFVNLFGLGAFSTLCALLSRMFLKVYCAGHFQNLYYDTAGFENCNVIVLIEKNESCHKYRILKIYEDVVHI